MDAARRMTSPTQYLQETDGSLKALEEQARGAAFRASDQG
jgi:hypothetical protein